MPEPVKNDEVNEDEIKPADNPTEVLDNPLWE
jgi:hypothetical protein